MVQCVKLRVGNTESQRLLAANTRALAALLSQQVGMVCGMHSRARHAKPCLFHLAPHRVGALPQG